MARAELGGTPELPGGETNKAEKQRSSDDGAKPAGEFFAKDVPEQTAPRRLSYRVEGRSSEVPSVEDATKTGELRAEAEHARAGLRKKLQRVTAPYAAMIRELAADLETEKRVSQRLEEPEERRRERKIPGERLLKRFLHKEEEEPEVVISTQEISLINTRTDESFPTQTTSRIEEDSDGFAAIPLAYKQSFGHYYSFEETQPHLAITFGDNEEIDMASLSFRIERRQDSLGTRQNQLFLPRNVLRKITELYPDAIQRLQEAHLPKRSTDLAVLELTLGKDIKADISFKAHPEFVLPGQDPEEGNDYQASLDFVSQYSLKGPTEEEQERLTDLTKEVFSLILASDSSSAS